MSRNNVDAILITLILAAAIGFAAAGHRESMLVFIGAALAMAFLAGLRIARERGSRD